MHTVRPNLPNAVASYIPFNHDLTRASYYLLSIGLITAIPAIISGGGEAVKLFQKQGMYEADGKTLKTKTKAVIAHAVVNDVAIAASAFVWYAKRQSANNSLMGKLGVTPEAAYAPTAWMVGAQVVLMGLLFFAASIGGALTYNYGVGFSAAKSGSKKSQ